jgi:hypothetical protein
MPRHASDDNRRCLPAGMQKGCGRSWLHTGGKQGVHYCQCQSPLTMVNALVGSLPGRHLPQSDAVRVHLHQHNVQGGRIPRQHWQHWASNRASRAQWYAPLWHAPRCVMLAWALQGKHMHS